MKSASNSYKVLICSTTMILLIYGIKSPIIKKSTNHKCMFLLDVFTLAVQKLFEPHLLRTVLPFIKTLMTFCTGLLPLQYIWSFLKQERYKGKLGHFSHDKELFSQLLKKSTVFKQLHRLKVKKSQTFSSENILCTF